MCDDDDDDDDGGRHTVKVQLVRTDQWTDQCWRVVHNVCRVNF